MFVEASLTGVVLHNRTPDGIFEISEVNETRSGLAELEAAQVLPERDVLGTLREAGVLVGLAGGAAASQNGEC